MSTLSVKLHPKASAELKALAESSDPTKQLAAAQLLTLMQLIKSHASIRDRLLGHHEDILIRSLDGKLSKIDIKIIKQLQSIAEDKYLTDAIRRIRDVSHRPADNYRVFYVYRKPLTNGTFTCLVLGIFDRNVAYTDQTLNELESRNRN